MSIMQVYDYREFKELVLTGLPKLVTGEKFTSDEERLATMEFLQRHGIPMSGTFLGFRLDQIEQEYQESTSLEEATSYDFDKEFKQAQIEAITQGVLSTFSGVYGIN